MSKLSELIYSENGLMIKLRMDNTFDFDSYEEIKAELINRVAEWKVNGVVPNKDVVAIVDLIDQLVGGNRFWSEKTAIMVEDAYIELEDIINGLIH